MDRLIDFIVDTDHVRLRAALPDIERSYVEAMRTQGGRNPALAAAVTTLQRVARELERHFAKEEQVLFPYLRQLAAAADARERAVCPFGTVENPVRLMEREHLEALDGLRQFRELIGHYPSDLQDFERELRRHFRLEDEVLFPRAIGLEAQSGLFG